MTTITRPRGLRKRHEDALDAAHAAAEHLADIRHPADDQREYVLLRPPHAAHAPAVHGDTQAAPLVHRHALLRGRVCPCLRGCLHRLHVRRRRRRRRREVAPCLAVARNGGMGCRQAHDSIVDCFQAAYQFAPGSPACSPVLSLIRFEV